MNSDNSQPDYTKNISMTPQEVISRARKVFNNKFCLHPEAGKKSCSKQIVQAHTIQRKGVLERIARNGHVYNFIPEPTSIIKRDHPVKPRLIGIRTASTFTGFCSHHDNQIFKPLETQPFNATQEQCFLLAYRAVCMELFKKASVPAILDLAELISKANSIKEQIDFQIFLDGYRRNEELAISELKGYKSVYDQSILNRDHKNTKYYIVYIDKIPEVMCSGLFQPQYDVSGNKIQDITNCSKSAEHATFSLIATKTGGAAIFSWDGESNAGIEFVKSMNSLSDNQIPHTLIRFAFEYFENIYLSPDWWESLNEHTRLLLENRIIHCIEHTISRKPGDLEDDNVRLVSWSITKRETNITI